MYTQQMSCIVIWSRVICFWMQIVILRLGILDLRGRHLKQTSWLSMLLPDGIVHQNCSLIVQNTLRQLIFGQWVVSLEKSWQGNLCFLAEIMSISWDLSQRYALWKPFELNLLSDIFFQLNTVEHLCCWCYPLPKCSHHLLWGTLILSFLLTAVRNTLRCHFASKSTLLSESWLPQLSWLFHTFCLLLSGPVLALFTCQLDSVRSHFSLPIAVWPMLAITQAWNLNLGYQNLGWRSTGD